jgi:hypothetical protein
VTPIPRAALALLFLLAAAPSFAQCEYRSIYSAQFRSTAFDLAIDGTDLWVASGYGVELYDRRTDPPVGVTSLPVPGLTTEVEASGGLAYAGSGSRIYTIRRTAPEDLAIVHTLEVGAPIVELLKSGNYLYAGTTTGIVQVDLLVPDTPAISNRLTTTAGPALSLAVSGGFLYAADDDSTVEVYTLQIPALPQRIGSFTSPRRASSIRAVGSQLFVSDGIQTEIFTAGGVTSIRLGGGAFPASSVAPHSGAVLFTAGADRRVRAIDTTDPATTVLLFEQELPASSGTVNRVADLASADGRVYAAAGDLGLLSFDARSFNAPYPVRALALGQVRSAVTAGNRIFAAPDAGGIRLFEVGSGGTLNAAGQWDVARVSTLHDATTRLLSSSGNTVSVSDVASPVPPAAVVTVTFRDVVRSAVLAGSSGYAVLNDLERSVWRFDPVSGGSPSQIPLGGALSRFIARGDTAVAIADVSEEGSTTVRFYANGDLASSPVVAPLEGAATSGIAVAGNVVAAVTFRGLVGLDFSSTPPAPITFRSGSAPARDLHARGGTLFVLTSSALEVWNVAGRTLLKTFPVIGTPFSVHAAERAVVATSEGIMSIDYAAPTSQPQLLPFPVTNRYFTRAAASGRQVRLLSGDTIASLIVDNTGRPYSTLLDPAPQGSMTIAAIGDRVFSLTASGRITGGNAPFQMNEGADASALGLLSAGEVLYLALQRGCSSGTCEKKTLILSTTGGTLAQIGSLTGAMLDVEVHGDRAFALFDDPDEVRVLGLQGAVIASAAAEGNAVAIGWSSSHRTVYTLGQRIYGYDDQTLAKTAELLEAYTPDPTGSVSYADQSLTIDGACAILAGRRSTPQVFRIVSPVDWQVVGAPAVPAPVRRVVSLGSTHYLLTDYSVEIWSTTLPDIRRRRPVR